MGDGANSRQAGRAAEGFHEKAIRCQRPTWRPLRCTLAAEWRGWTMLVTMLPFALSVSSIELGACWGPFPERVLPSWRRSVPEPRSRWFARPPRAVTRTGHRYRSTTFLRPPPHARRL